MYIMTLPLFRGRYRQVDLGAKEVGGEEDLGSEVPGLRIAHPGKSHVNDLERVGVYYRERRGSKGGY